MSNRNKRNNALSLLRIGLMSLAMLILMFLAFSYFVGRRHYVVHEQTFYFYDLPEEFDGYRILQFSDLHVGTFTRYRSESDVDYIVRLINSQHCDAVFFVGDMICLDSGELDCYTHKLKQITAPDGVYAIMGNHDYGTYSEFPTDEERLKDVEELQKKERKLGWNLLLNQNALIHRGKSSLAVIGVENEGRPPFPAYSDLPKALEGVESADFCILLTHDPTHWQNEVVSETSIQLTLSGHTHGGQMQYFGWSPSSFRYREWTGPYVEESQILNVSNGVGCSLNIPFRFGAWPEVNVITLKKY